jgi:ketosteroid isomerase-like protein
VGDAHVWIVAVAITGACSGKPGPTPPRGSGPERLMLAYTSALNRGAVDENLALFTDDVEIFGIGNCRGTPCVGREAARIGYLEEAVAEGIERENVGWTVDGDRVVSWYQVHPGHSWPRTAEYIRGMMTFTVRDGHIARVENRHQIDDPETVVIRQYIGDVLFALRPMGKREILARVQVVKHGPAEVSIALTLADAVAGRQGLSAWLRDGTCANRTATAREIHVVKGVWEDRFDIGAERLQTVPFSVELRRGSAPIACGNFPRKPPT